MPNMSKDKVTKKIDTNMSHQQTFIFDPMDSQPIL
jgi:hypothetical protein